MAAVTPCISFALFSGLLSMIKRECNQVYILDTFLLSNCNAVYILSHLLQPGQRVNS